MVHSSICLIFSIESISNFSRNSTLVFESFIRLSMFVTSASVSPAQSVTISQTKSILGFGTAVKRKEYCLAQFLRELMQDQSMESGFLSDLANWLIFFVGLAASGLSFLARCAKSSLSKFKSLIFVGSISCLHGSHSFAEMVHDRFVKPV